MGDLSHVDRDGVSGMVDIAQKTATQRVAVCSGVVSPSVQLSQLASLAQIDEVCRVARIAAVQAAKQTANLIPFCHSICLAKMDVDIQYVKESNKFLITTTSSTKAETGVEMEGLTAAHIAALTVYDMIKAIDPAATMGPFQLDNKQGGKAGPWQRP